jgi:hypothetical protein
MCIDNSTDICYDGIVKKYAHILSRPPMTERGDTLAISDARRRANDKWNAKAYDTILVRVYKGKKDEIKTYADAQGESVNGFINRAIDETIERDKGGGA